MSISESSVALANVAAAQSAALNGVPPAHPAEAKPAESSASATPDKPAVEKAAPLAILPDELHPQVRPEDFLPFFQIPGAATGPGDVTLVVPVPRNPPAPPTQPTSSATYTQTQK